MTTPVPSRCGPRVRALRASGTVLTVNFTTENWSSVNSRSAARAGAPDTSSPAARARAGTIPNSLLMTP